MNRLSSRRSLESFARPFRSGRSRAFVRAELRRARRQRSQCGLIRSRAGGRADLIGLRFRIFENYVLGVRTTPQCDWLPCNPGAVCGTPHRAPVAIRPLPPCGTLPDDQGRVRHAPPALGVRTAPPCDWLPCDPGRVRHIGSVFGGAQPPA